MTAHSSIMRQWDNPCFAFPAAWNPTAETLFYCNIVFQNHQKNGNNEHPDDNENKSSYQDKFQFFLVVFSHGAEGENRTPYASLFRSSSWTISSPRLKSGAGRLCEIIVGTHSLVSTPFPQPMPCGTRLGIVLPKGKVFPEFTQFFSIPITRDGPKEFRASLYQ